MINVNVVIKIEGRDALPVWTIPYVTSWDIDTDMLTKRLMCPRYNDMPTFPSAFGLDQNNHCHTITSINWIDTATYISYLEDELEEMKASNPEKMIIWQRESINIITRMGCCYIWLDEFIKWLERYNNCSNDILMRPADNGKGFTTYRIEPSLNPRLSPEHAVHFKNTEIRGQQMPLPSEESDPRIRYRNKFAKTITLLELKQRWSSNYEFINELAFAKEIRPYLNDREGFVDTLNGTRYIKFLWPTKFDEPVVEDVDSFLKYESLPDDTYFYWTGILEFEEKHPEFKKRPSELDDESSEHKLHKSVTSSTDIKPWLIANSEDPTPTQPWYTPARYFTRQHVIDAPSLLADKKKLESKVVLSLNNAGIKTSRKGIFSKNGTIKKAWVNVDLG